MPLLLCILIGIISRPFFSLQPYMAVAGGIFLFISGSEISLRRFDQEAPLVFKLWLGAFLPPFLVGAALPFLFSPFFAGPAGVGISDTAYILGVALAVSAVPVVIKIMQEIGWAGTLRAQRIVLTAVLCDVAAWVMFFFVLPSDGQTSWFRSHWSLLMFLVGLVVAYILPSLPQKIAPLLKINQWIIAPIFFIGVGQALDLSLGVHLPQIIFIFVAATLSKTIGVWIMAKFAKLPREEMIAISITLNARGAMEVIMAKFALSAGLITNEFFLSLVVMALGTSLIIKPIFRWGRWFENSTAEIETVPEEENR